MRYQIGAACAVRDVSSPGPEKFFDFNVGQATTNQTYPKVATQVTHGSLKAGAQAVTAGGKTCHRASLNDQTHCLGKSQRKKPRNPCQDSGFWTLPALAGLCYGGGGGSRTRVRKYSPSGVYILSPVSLLIASWHPPGQEAFDATLLDIRRRNRRYGPETIPLGDALL